MTTSTSGFRDRRTAATDDDGCRRASFAQLDAGPPQRIEPDGSPTWIARGANFVVCVSWVVGGAELVQEGIPDESMVLLSPGVPVTLETGTETQTIDEEALAILPPGDARLTAHAEGWVVRIYSSAAGDFGAVAANCRDYASGAPDVAPIKLWPDPEGGFRLRVYPLKEHNHDVGFGRLFRSTNLMINVLPPAGARRDPARLSPHHHEDFEQGSLTLGGEFVHFLRTPWGPDSRQWRSDERIACDGVSLTVIPPRMIHTTSWAGAGARLVDVFSPPREDFSLRPLWVRNAADYPLPERLRAG